MSEVVLSLRKGQTWTRIGKDPSEFTEDTKFADLGIKSVQVSQITTYLEDELDIEVPYMKFRRCETFGEATDFVCDLLDQ